MGRLRGGDEGAMTPMLATDAQPGRAASPATPTTALTPVRRKERRDGAPDSGGLSNVVMGPPWIAVQKVLKRRGVPEASGAPRHSRHVACVGFKKRTKHDAIMCEAILGVSAQRVSAPESKLRTGDNLVGCGAIRAVSHVTLFRD